jgi:hypothetical protein
MQPPASLDSRLYHAALFLYPPAFRREFSSEMILDFNEARDETQQAGDGRGLWAFRADISADLVSTVVLQWMRTGWPVIVLLSMIVPLTAASALATLWKRTHIVLPHGSPDADVITLVLMVVVVLLVIAATIIFNHWFTRPLLNRHRRRP